MSFDHVASSFCARTTRLSCLFASAGSGGSQSVHFFVTQHAVDCNTINSLKRCVEIEIFLLEIIYYKNNI